MEKIVLFGTGSSGEKAYNRMKNQYEILYFCDNNSEKWGSFFCGLEIVPPDSLKTINSVHVVIASMYAFEIAEQLSQLGIRNYSMFRPEISSIEHLVDTDSLSERQNSICLITTSYSGSNIVALYKLMPDYIKEKYHVSFCHASERNNDFFKDYDFLNEIMNHRLIVFDVRAPGYKRKDNVFFQLWHGFPLKGLGYMSPSTEEVAEKNHLKWKTYDYIASYSPFYNMSMSACMGIPDDQFKITGMPRNDFLFRTNGNRNLSRLLGQDMANKKVIFFMPTYRNSDILNESSGLKKWHNIFGMDEFDEQAFETFLEVNQLHVVFKTHPLEEEEVESLLVGKELNHCSLLTNRMLDEYKMDLYETLNAAAFLITDYSSVYIDFLLLDRPLIFVPVDLQIYEQTRGLTLKPYEAWTPGPKVLTQSDLEMEIHKILEGEDGYAGDRKRMLDLCHTYKQEGASENVWNEISKML